MNGRVGNDSSIGRYTFVGHRGRSVLDYVLGSQDMFKFIKCFKVSEPNFISDHFLISFSFEFGSNMYTQNAQIDDCEYVREKYVWNAESKDEFINRLERESVVEKHKLLNVNISNSTNENDIQSCLADFVI